MIVLARHSSAFNGSPGRIAFFAAAFIAAISIPQAVHAQYNPYGQIHSFGNVNEMSTHPTAPVIEGSDGVLYGTFYTGGAGDVGGLFRSNKDGSGFAVLRAYSATGGDGQNPADGLMENSSGFLCGTTTAGGANGGGIVFRIGKSGSGYLILHQFPSSVSDGQIPYGGLIEGYPGTLYGTTSRGGTGGAGTVFEVNADGTGYKLLHSFHSTDAGGSNPHSSLLLGSDGKLYGTTLIGGPGGVGTLFRLNTGGTNFMVLHSFTRSAGDGANPRDALIEGGDGLLYGTTDEGGSMGNGTIFKLNKDGSNYSVIFNFDSATGSGVSPEAPLLEGQDGLLYGTSSSGGPAGGGTAFKLNKDGTGFTHLHDFSSANTDAAGPQAALIQAGDGMLYGTTTSGGPGGDGAIYKVGTDGSQYEITHNFSSTGGEGRFVPAPITTGPAGMLYGTTQQGGLTGDGTVFKLATDGTALAIIHSFAGGNEDGAQPYAALISGPDGFFYGTTYLGGTGNLGTAFKLDTSGNRYAVLHNFPDDPMDGAKPEAALLAADDGLLYGTTAAGGVANVGTIFKMDSTGGNYSVLHQFTGGDADGKYPESALVESGDGILFGITFNGGASGAGAVYRINKDGSGFLILHHFQATNSDGILPKGTLLIASDGMLYGMTLNGGTAGFGTVYRLKRDGTGYSVLRSFTGLNGDAANPEAGLVEGPDGALYGTTYKNGGTIFRMNRDGTGFSVRHTFSSDTGDGAFPVAAMVMGNDGLLYGTTEYGGAVGFGTVFRISLDALFAPRISTGGSFAASFAGTPGMKWSIQRAPEITGPWNPIGSVTPDGSGLGQMTDSNPPAQRSFYRMVLP